MTARLLDSVILIDHLNGVTAATYFIKHLDPGITSISVITRAEILVGLDVAGEELVKPFLDLYNLIIIDKPMADLAAQLRRVHSWKLPDAFQAAISVHYKLRLTTRNTKDFNPEKHDFVEVPYIL